MDLKELVSQSPQIGSMFLTQLKEITRNWILIPGRNPLKSGQCFLRKRTSKDVHLESRNVAIPSNRVNVSYIIKEISTFPDGKKTYVAIPSNRVNVSYFYEDKIEDGYSIFAGSQSPQIGSMFLNKR